MKFTTSQQIKWSFIPEHSPYFGGIWEAAVKSAKFHLKRILGDHKLTFEELSTVLCQIEACLNSRPLVPLVTPNIEGIDCLTPGHFLVGRPIQALPEKNISPSLTLLRRWNLCNKLSHEFWKRWSLEYLHYLQCTTKWNKVHCNFALGDIVLIKDDFKFKQQWPMGKIIAVHPGQDGKVRVATVKTAGGIFK